LPADSSALLQVFFMISLGKRIFLQFSHSSLSKSLTLSEIKYSYSSAFRKHLLLKLAVIFL